MLLSFNLKVVSTVIGWMGVGSVLVLILPDLDEPQQMVLPK